jgi:sialic acid synthase SpsE
MTMPLTIANRPIGREHPPFVIAEMSGNHNQSLDRALAIVEAAAHAGTYAIKLQTYTADTMTLPVTGGDFVIGDPDSLWHGRDLYDLYCSNGISGSTPTDCQPRRSFAFPGRSSCAAIGTASPSELG